MSRSKKPPEPRDDSLIIKSEELGGRYELISVIGSGGFATIYRAHDLNMGVDVAIKVLKEKWSENEEFRRRFLQESKHHATLKHPRIVPVSDRGTTAEGRLYFVMDLLHGQSLDEFLSSHPGPLAWDEVISIIVQICEGLDFAHRRRVVHRDIKPANVFLEDRDQLSVKLLDLGIAKELPGESSAGGGNNPTPLTDITRGAPGTPEYMAPEQVRTETSALDGRTDIYALGVMMYLMLAGTLPFRAPEGLKGVYRHHALLQMHASDTVEPISQRAPEAQVPKLIEGIVMQALAKSPDDRFESARDLRDALLFAQRRLTETGRATAFAGHRRERLLIRLAATFSSLTTAVSVFLLLLLVELPGVQCAVETLTQRQSVPAAQVAIAAPQVQVQPRVHPDPQSNRPQPAPAPPPPPAPPPDDQAMDIIIDDDEPPPTPPAPTAKNHARPSKPRPKPRPNKLMPIPTSDDPVKMFNALVSRSRTKTEKQCASSSLPSKLVFEISIDKSSTKLSVRPLTDRTLSPAGKCALKALGAVSVSKSIRAAAPRKTKVTLKV